MWDRALLKQNGKAAFKRNYWWAVLWALVFTVLIAVGSSSGNDEDIYRLSYTAAIVLGVIGGAFSLLSVAVRIVVGGPFRVGYSRWLLHCAEGQPAPADLGHFFKEGRMGRAIAGIFCTDLVIGLWTLLFIVPGIVAKYKYQLVPYLMAENEWMTGKEARQRSAELMNGYKGEAFVLDLSFIGWFLLDVLTLGILGVFYVNPYIYATHCELYRAIRDCSCVNQQGSGWQPPYEGQNNGWQPPYEGQNGGWQAPYESQNNGWQTPGAAPAAENPQNSWNGGDAQSTGADAEQAQPVLNAWENVSGQPAAEEPQPEQAAAQNDGAEPEADTAAAEVPGETEPTQAAETPESSEEPDSVICPTCGHRVTLPAHFCNMCGTRL